MGVDIKYVRAGLELTIDNNSLLTSECIDAYSAHMLSLRSNDGEPTLIDHWIREHCSHRLIA